MKSYLLLIFFLSSIPSILSFTTYNFAATSQRLPLHHACLHEDLIRVLTLLESGKNPNQQDADGKTALHIACIKNNWLIIYHLIKYGALLYTKDLSGKSPLDYYSGDKMMLQCIAIQL